MPAGEVASLTNPQCFYVNNGNNEPPPLPVHLSITSTEDDGKKKNDNILICDVCQEKGAASNIVTYVTNKRVCKSLILLYVLYRRCDECHKGYHFTCLDPPLKKTPKRRGYSWHCADCDPTVSASTFTLLNIII